MSPGAKVPSSPPLAPDGQVEYCLAAAAKEILPAFRADARLQASARLCKCWLVILQAKARALLNLLLDDRGASSAVDEDVRGAGLAEGEEVKRAHPGLDAVPADGSARRDTIRGAP